MAVTKTEIRREDWEVEPRLAELELEKKKLLSVRTTAIGAAADATPFFPANAAGTLSYQYGTFALRNEHVGDNWQIDRPNGVEVIKNDARRVMLVFANVDIACNDEHQPKARSEKGAGAERLCGSNGLFDDLPRYVNVENEGWLIFYLMVAPNGAVELSRATVEKRRFDKFIERIYLSDGSDLDTEPKLFDDDLPADSFDPQVARK